VSHKEKEKEKKSKITTCPIKRKKKKEKKGHHFPICMLGDGEGLKGAFFLQPCASLDVRHRSHNHTLMLRIRIRDPVPF
jgi:hypothetical protein